MLADETNLFSVEDGIKWLNQIFQIKEDNWFSLFDFLPRVFKSTKKISYCIDTTCVIK